jgi:hypothetical protein
LQLYDKIVQIIRKMKAFIEEVYNKAENIRNKRGAVYGVEKLNRAELRARSCKVRVYKMSRKCS